MNHMYDKVQVSITNKNKLTHRHVIGNLWAIRYEDKCLNICQREDIEHLQRNENGNASSSGEADDGAGGL